MTGIGMKSKRRRDWSEARAKVEREGQCRHCATLLNLEAAHVIPRSLGGGQSEDAIIPLCRTCHTEYDAGHLDLLPDVTYAEQAEAVRVLGIERARRRISGLGREFGER